MPTTAEGCGTQATLEEAARSTSPSAGKVKKRRGRKKMTVDCADERSQRQSGDIHIVDSGSSFKDSDVYADKAIHECDVHMNNSYQAESGTLCTETPEDIGHGESNVGRVGFTR
jgi:hypothetical protein